MEGMSTNPVWISKFFDEYQRKLDESCLKYSPKRIQDVDEFVVGDVAL